MKRLAVVTFLFFCWISVSRGEVFRDGETVCFLGDSITHGGRFHSYVYDYYLTRFPERKIRFVNAGVAGDSAGGAQGRLTEDVTDKKPTSVAVMFGMNDVGRGDYVAEPTAQQLAAQRAALDGYRKNQERLAERLRTEAGNPKLIFLTPSPFDQTAVNDRNNNQPGCNDGLGQCAAIIRALAEKSGGTVVDFYAPMTALNVELQKADPRDTLIGQDRVHPGAPGHLVMAWLFLKAQGAPALVSRVGVDAAKQTVCAAENAAVSDVSAKDGGVSFSALERALPFPVADGALPALKLAPVERDLNQELLSVSGLAPGTYELCIDAAPVGRFDADALAAGINLATNALAPQVKQAKAVAALNETRCATESVLRNYAAVRWFLRWRQVNPDDMEAVRVFAETKMSKTGYFEEQVPTYREKWASRAETLAAVARQEEALFQARTPVAHAYAIRPVR